MTRFDDSATYLSEFTDVVDVRCPRCGSRAAVISGPARGEGRAVCSRCGFTGLSQDGWLGPVTGHVRRRCTGCRQWLDQRFTRGAHDPARLRCACGCAFEEPITWTRVGHLTDPILGLDLWLQAPFKQHVLWAYNGIHLAFLRDYVAAPLRHREPNRNASLASRLPAWLKAASNRTALLASISKLEGTIDTTGAN